MINEIDKEIVNLAMLNIKKMFDIGMEYSVNTKSNTFHYDGVLRIGDVRFLCVIKHRVTDYNLNTIIRSCNQIKSETGMSVLLLSHEISPKLVMALHEMGINSMDAAGNCHIQHGGLMMFCKGRKNDNIVIRESISFKEPGLKVLFFILSDLNNVNRSFRDIQAQTGVGLATINKLFSSLKQNGFIFSTQSGRHLKNTMRLLSVFVDNYCSVMKPKSLMATMKMLPDFRATWSDSVLPTGMTWGGEPGAFLKDRYLIPEVFDIYSTTSSSQLIASRIGVPSKDGEIRVYRRFWVDDEDSNCAPALIIYADLMGSGDSRCIEAAQRIFDHELSYLR